MINFNKSSESDKKETSHHCTIKKRRPKGQLSKENKQFLKSLGLIK